MNTKIKKIIVVSGVVFLLSASQTFAVMRVPFPNSSSLQPLPIDVQPNITNNANSGTTTTGIDTDQPAVQSEERSQTGVQGAGQGSNMSWYFYVGIIVGLVFVFAMRYFLRKKK